MFASCLFCFVLFCFVLSCGIGVEKVAKPPCFTLVPQAGFSPVFVSLNASYLRLAVNKGRKIPVLVDGEPLSQVLFGVRGQQRLWRSTSALHHRGWHARLVPERA